MRAIVRGLPFLDPAGRGLRAQEIVARMADPFAPQAVAEMRAAIEEVCRPVDGRTLGYLFRRLGGRNFGGSMIVAEGLERGSARWRAVPVGRRANAC